MPDYEEFSIYFRLAPMGRIRVLFFVFEFWSVIVVFVPFLLSAIWFGFRNYFAAQNALLAKYKPTIDTAALLVAVGSLIVGYASLMHEFQKLADPKAEQPSPLTRMQTKATGKVNVRRCAQPDNARCPILIELPPRSEVELLPETSAYIDSRSGNRSSWRKIKYQSSVGWVNEALLWPL